jgi:DNA-binding PadR family transcriptional regulator
VTQVWVDVLLLANLAGAPSHGYELRRRVEETSGYALSNNSLYPALRRFLDAGAVLKSAEPQEGRPSRHVYTLTAVGRELLRDMLADLPDELAGEDAEFLSRLGHFGWLDPGERLQVLDARRRALERREERLARLSSGQPEDGWARLALDEVVHRIHRELEWLGDMRVRASQEPGEPGEPPAHGSLQRTGGPRSPGRATPQAPQATWGAPEPPEPPGALPAPQDIEKREQMR